MEEEFEKLGIDNPQLTVLSECSNEDFRELVKKSFN